MSTGADASSVLSPDALEARLREILETRYHHRHPFNLRMHAGTLTRRELQVWASNRYYYQTRIPVKDGMILAKSPDASFRREWVQRIHDHDGDRPGEGGLELWLGLAEAVGCERAEVESLAHVLPGVRRACDAYVALVEESDLLTSVAASLTELYAGEIMKVRIEAFERHYAWVGPEGLRYFGTRTEIAPRDAHFGLGFVKQHAQSVEDQQRAIRALERKCEILWGLLDAIERACGIPALVRHARVRDDADGPMVVLPERAVKLGGSASTILALCDGERSGEEIAASVREAHAGPEDVGERIADDVHEFLAEMQRAGVLEFSTQAERAARAEATQ